MTDQTPHAIIRTGGKQYRVATGGKLRVEKLNADIGSTVTFDQVLLVGNGEAAKVGAPYVAGAKVVAEVKAHGRGKKVIIFKFRRRKGYQRKNGHRQHYTEVMITQIAG